jgi:hypothetical protein
MPALSGIAPSMRTSALLEVENRNIPTHKKGCLAPTFAILTVMGQLFKSPSLFERKQLISKPSSACCWVFQSPRHVAIDAGQS